VKSQPILIIFGVRQPVGTWCPEI